MISLVKSPGDEVWSCDKWRLIKRGESWHLDCIGKKELYAMNFERNDKQWPFKWAEDIIEKREVWNNALWNEEEWQKIGELCYEAIKDGRAPEISLDDLIILAGVWIENVEGDSVRVWLANEKALKKELSKKICGVLAKR